MPAAQAVETGEPSDYGAAPAPQTGGSSLIYVAAYVASLAFAAVAAARFVAPDTVVVKPLIVANDEPRKILDTKPDPGIDNPHLRDNPFKPDPKPGPDPEPQKEPKLEPKPEPKKEEPKPELKLKHEWIVDAKGAPDADGTDVATVLGKVAANDKITVRPGTYEATLTLTKPVRLIGDKKGDGHVVIKSPGLNKECASVRAKGVSFENLEFVVDSSGSTAAVSVTGDSELLLLGCSLQSKSRSGLAGTDSASITATNCVFTNIEGSSVDLDKLAVIQMTDCSFNHDTSGVMTTDGARATLKSCKFVDMGQPNGGGSHFYVRGEKAAISAEKCDFNQCRSSINVLQKAMVTLLDCTVADNGVADEPSAWTNGLLEASQGGHAKITRTTFRSNRQGLVARTEGTLELEDCHFTGNGMQTSNPSLSFYGDNISVTGESTAALVKHCDFAGAVRTTMSVSKGATLAVINSDISSSANDGLSVGLGALPPAEPGAAATPGNATSAAAHAEVKDCHFTGNLRGIVAGAGGSVTVAGSTCTLQGKGLVVQDAGTKVELESVTVSGCRDQAITCHGGAEVSANTCTLEGNGSGVLVGPSPKDTSKDKDSAKDAVKDASKDSSKTTVSLEDCKLATNSNYDATVGSSSVLVLQNCTFGTDGKGKPKLVREKGAEIQADPPIASLASADTGSGSDSGSGSSSKKSSTRKKKEKSTGPNGFNRFLNNFKKFIPSQ